MSDRTKRRTAARWNTRGRRGARRVKPWPDRARDCRNAGLWLYGLFLPMTGKASPSQAHLSPAEREEVAKGQANGEYANRTAHAGVCKAWRR